MAKPGQSSFRRILLSRILLLSIPVLLVGETVAYRKARSGMLDTARYNLTTSAIEKGEGIQNSIEALRASLSTATTTAIVQAGPSQALENFLLDLSQLLPEKIQCIQLINLQTHQVESSTCGKQPIATVPVGLWSQTQPSLIPDRSNIRFLSTKQANLPKHPEHSQLSLVLSAPVYLKGDLTTTQTTGEKRISPIVSNPVGLLRYALVAQATLYEQKREQPGSLSGSTVVINQDGTILAHPNPNRIGHNIQQESDAVRLDNIVRNALAGRQDALHLFSFEKNGAEWIAGYSAITLPVSMQQNYTWVVLAVTPLSNALYGLEEIKQVLIILTLGLITTNVLATIYLARDMARPLEQLGDYALRIHQHLPSDRIPKNFKVRELNQLAEALDTMVHRLQERAEELEAAWQEAQAANQLKSEFLATTSHELRTPLNAIIGCIQLVRDGCCDDREEEMEFLLQANDAAMHLLKIINDLLDISKIEAGKVELNLQPVSIKELCQQCLKMIQPGAEKKQLSVALELDHQLDWVPLDERRVRQMVINLLSNAVKFTPEGGEVKLSSRLAYGEQLIQDNRPDNSPINPTTPYLCLEVADSGIGIPEDRWHLLFRPFQQADGTWSRKHEGTGLGLALTKRLAELHGGTTSFRSVHKQGSIFRIWLPWQEAKNSPADIAKSAEIGSSSSSGNPLGKETMLPKSSEFVSNASQVVELAAHERSLQPPSEP
ncbi:MAG: sensor histidine kinase [Scytolyngbya sp. HA4215-MV1]|jgi:signal transduction histidine kinase|nr:sensor histidine kinase [Scytolyngbya sp. HA4215-MV1]